MYVRKLVFSVLKYFYSVLMLQPTTVKRLEKPLNTSITKGGRLIQKSWHGYCFSIIGGFISTL